MTDHDKPTSSAPRSFGDLSPAERLGPVVGIGETPFGQAKPVPEIYCVVDHHSDGSVSVARFTDVAKAVELFQTAGILIAVGTIKGCQLLGSVGEVIDTVGIMPVLEDVQVETTREDDDRPRT